MEHKEETPSCAMSRELSDEMDGKVLSCFDVEADAMKCEVSDERLRKVLGYFDIETDTKKDLMKAVLEATFIAGWNAGFDRALYLKKELPCSTQ